MREPIAERDGLTPAERKAAWLRQDPAELRRAADEWEALGHVDYATYLRAWARGERPTKAMAQPPAVLRLDSATASMRDALVDALRPVMVRLNAFAQRLGF